MSDFRIKAISEYCQSRLQCEGCPLQKGCDFGNFDEWNDEKLNQAIEKINKQKGAQLDVVNHPEHYTNGDIECIDAMVAAYGKEAVSNFCLCNCMKYLWRNRLKNGLEDCQKLKYYLIKYMELEYGYYEDN